VINIKPSPASRNRLPSQTNLWDGWGEGFGAWGLVCGGRDQRGAGVGSGPVASLPHVEPSRCPAGVGSGDTSVALELAPATHVGGQRPAPTGRMPGESPTTVIHGRGDSACMAVDGLKLREQGRLRSSLCFDDGRRQFTNGSRLLQQPQLS
jgi:hypothetical protein